MASPKPTLRTTRSGTTATFPVYRKPVRRTGRPKKNLRSQPTTPETQNTRPEVSLADWVTSFSEEELNQKLQRFHLSCEGSIMARQLRLHSFMGGNQPIPHNPPSTGSARRPDELLNQVRKWNLHYDGKSDAIAFMERLDELIMEYEISREDMLRALPELFRGQASLWHRNCRDRWMNWMDFCADFESFFYPPSYTDSLDDAIHRRYQKPEESGKDFIVALQTLLRRRGGYSAFDEVSIIYKHLSPNYRQYIRRMDVHDITNLIAQVYEYEELMKETKELKNPARRTTIHAADVQNHSETPPVNRYSTGPQTSPAAARNSNFICWKCGIPGHTRYECRNQPRLFCSRCLRPDVLSRDCRCPSRHQGNGRRVGPSPDCPNPQ